MAQQRLYFRPEPKGVVRPPYLGSVTGPRRIGIGLSEAREFAQYQD
jgi:hypothetical protein